MSRVLCWFSCGAASAVAAKLAVEKYGERAEVLYCDTFEHEHPDNHRFFDDVQRWLGREIKVLRSEDYTDIYDVFERTGWLIGPGGARCTTEMKKVPRKKYQEADDIHVFGYTVEEPQRVVKLHRENPELFTEFPLIDAGIAKSECWRRIAVAGIAMPAMYRMGYKNNNCIGCVKGGAGYWNKIRRDFPQYFERMARQERRLGVSIVRRELPDGTKERVFLDELPPTMGRYQDEPDIECGVLCSVEHLLA